MKTRNVRIPAMVLLLALCTCLGYAQTVNSKQMNEPEVLILNAANNGASYVTCDARLLDNGGATGPIGDNQGGRVNIISSAGTHIQATKVAFQVGGILKIFDVDTNTGTERLIGKFCSSTSEPPATLISTGQMMSFEYIPGNSDANKSGWEFLISCVDAINESLTGSAFSGISISTTDANGNYVETDYIESDCNDSSRILKANITPISTNTSDYMVVQVPYNPTFPFSAGMVIPASTDDNWLDGVQLPFTFSFYGHNYDTVYPGCNGLISFTPRAGWCKWCTTSDCPTSTSTPPYAATPYLYSNCLYGVMEDIYPGHYLNDGAIRFGVMGEYPSRAFVFNYDYVGLYSCYTQGSDMYNSYQMVLYEGTNILEVNVRHRNYCSQWNNGNGVIGIQNATSSQMLIAPERDFDDHWTADNESWRFVPISTMTSIGNVEWYADDTSTVCLGNGMTLSVSPSQTTRYIAKYSSINAGGELITYLDTITMNVGNPVVENVVPVHQNTVNVNFSRTVTEATAENIDNYVFDNNLTVLNASFIENVVTLTTSDMVALQDYTLIVRNVEDLDGNAMCPDTVSFVYNNVSVQNLDNNVAVYPNPTNGTVVFQIGSPVETVMVYDINGKLVANATVSDNRMNVSHLDNGVYFAKLYRQNELLGVSKIVKF